ncbi:MAG: type I secretion system permease/ATPase [Rhodobacterales bacterium]|nr:MAG: type I secretion system permease/ATPase [Rhodobacterales bacterium]
MSQARKSSARELAQIRSESRALYWVAGVFSFFVNLLMLTGPLYMLNVYDRVLGSRSVETLVALSVLAGFMFAMMGLLDFARGRIMGRVGARFQSRLDRRVFEASLRASTRAGAGPEAATGLRDLEAVQRLMTSPVLMAFFDIPWSPLFFAGIFLFHPWLGWLALAGSACLMLIAWANQMASRAALEHANASGFRAEQLGAELRGEAEMVQALGMRGATFARWSRTRNAALEATIQAADRSGGFMALTRTVRLALQSAMLGLGAYLVLREELTAGAMIAGSILLGRALSPVELLVNQWPVVERGKEGWANLTRLLASAPKDSPRTALPRPRAILEARQATVVPPGQHHATLRGISFRVEPGQALGVIGPSGAGKSTLARALTGVWPLAGGSIRLDGASLDQYDPDALGHHIGYLPQRVQLFEGTIRDNIARMEPEPDDAAVVEAARNADAHDMILALPNGYDTMVSPNGGQLSGGQMQRIGLARALYGDPVVLVLDEPNSNLDHAGNEALNAAMRRLKADGRVILTMAHRPAAIQECDLLLVIEEGAMRAFGPRDRVLRETVTNHADIAMAPSRVSGRKGGVA